VRTAKELLEHVPQVGRVTWIGVRPARGEPMIELESVDLLADRGLAGDRASARKGRRRQVSLVQAEHLDVVARLLRTEAVDPAIVRRNLVVEGINLRALRKATFWVGECVLRGVGDCDPCSKMEAALGDGGFAAMRGHGGIVAKVLEGGVLHLGAAVRFAS